MPLTAWIAGPSACESCSTIGSADPKARTLRFRLRAATAPLDVYTTRPDTIFGASFMAIAANHPLAADLAQDNPALQDFITQCNRMGTSEAAIETAEKLGFATGLHCVHPTIEGETLPIYVANFVLMDYGTGAIFGCPATCSAGFGTSPANTICRCAQWSAQMAQIRQPSVSKTTPMWGPGRIVNSGFLNGLEVDAAKSQIIAHFEERGMGKRQVNFRLRDWGVSRQRYWGCPIPIIHCDACGAVPVPEDQLPMTLPEDVDIDVAGNPLDLHPTWKHVACPSCGEQAVRETDTFDTFFESSWYFARFCSPASNIAFGQRRGRLLAAG